MRRGGQFLAGRTGVVGVVWLVGAGPAYATGLDPRTPVQWPADTPCMTVVDRSQDPVLHLSYEIPYEDTELAPEDLPGSRRHQFLAFAEDHVWWDIPVWLSWADVDAWNAWQVELGEPAIPFAPEHVLEDNDTFTDVFLRITPDEARRPITFAEAQAGVDWDTTGLAPGAYVVRGYTWHPFWNLWRRRPGVVHVVDGPDLAAAPPAAALTFVEYGFADDGIVLPGCARALAGSTLRASWAAYELDKELVWTTFAEEVPIESDVFELLFLPPPEAVKKSLAVRVEVTDPLARTYTAYATGLLVVLPGTEACTIFADEACTGGESPTTSDASTTIGDVDVVVLSTSSTGTAGEEPPATAGGCACRGSGNTATIPWLMFVFALARRRR